MSIELEEMNEEQLKRLQEFLKSTINGMKNELDWRDSEDAELLPLLQGLTRYLAKEYLHEEEETNELDDEQADDNDEWDELDF